jgi:hypothetical protein
MSPPFAKKVSVRKDGDKDGDKEGDEDGHKDGDKEGGAEVGPHGRIAGEVPVVVVVQAGVPHDVAVGNVDVVMGNVDVVMDAGAHARRQAEPQNPVDIDLVVANTGKSRDVAAAALSRDNGDVINAIIELSVWLYSLSQLMTRATPNAPARPC